jgi:nitrilase
MAWATLRGRKRSELQAPSPLWGFCRSPGAGAGRRRHRRQNRAMKIAALQMVSTPDPERNLDTAARLIADAAALGARLVALPEYFCLMARRDDDKLRIAEAPDDGPIQRHLADAARRHGLWVVGGTLPLRGSDASHALNSCLVYAPDGSRAARYDKIHLFAYDNGRERYDEGRTLNAGSQPVALQADALRVGLSICYDLRFPELYRALMVPPCDLLVVPAAFTYTTGRAHWELLLRARAVENQCYVLAAAQGGTHENGRRTWGHSLICDPWGEVLSVQAEGEGVVVAEVDAARIAEVRTQLPALGHRRL